VAALSRPLILKDMIATEFTLKMLALGARLWEVPVVYYSRQGKSRGMPPKKIPRLKKEIARLRVSIGTSEFLETG
jgi:hypothetical protein